MKQLIEFTKDYATKKKGDTIEVDGILASTLVAQKVAKKRERKPKQSKSK